MPESPLSRFGRVKSRLCFAAAFGLLALTFSWPVFAQTVFAQDDALLCDRAAHSAAQKHNVPLDVLRSITRLETGRKQGGVLRPWPWALNAGGPGYRLASKDATLAKANTILATGTRNLDFGCFQLNYRWHGQHFASLSDMLDPEQNADYAARYLRQLFQRLGDWTSAVAAYHSRTPHYAKIYLARYHAIAQDLGPIAPATLAATAPAPQRTTNGFALLTGTGRGALGSVVPVSLLGPRGRLVPANEGAQ